MTTHHPGGQCPECGSKIDGSTPCGDDSELHPEPGDISMCLYCGVWLLFDAHLLPTIRATELDARMAPIELQREAERIRERYKARWMH